MNSSPAIHLHRASRVAKWIASIAGGLVAVMAVAVVAAYFALQTQSGGRLLRWIAVGQVNKTLVGHLDLGAVEFRGNALSLRDVTLSDTQNIPVVKLGRLTVTYGLRGLLARRIDVKSIEVEQPALYLRQDVNGLNLSRALTERNPQPPEPPKADESKGKGWQLNLVRFRVAGGIVEFTKIPASGVADIARITLAQLAILAAGRLQTVDKNGEFHLALSGSVDGPGGISASSISINVHVVERAGEPRGTADINLGTLLVVVARIDSQNEGALEVRSLRLPPALAGALVSSWPVRVPLLLSGSAAIKGGDIATVDLLLRGEGVAGNLSVHGDASLLLGRTPHGIQVVARGVQLSEFVGSVAPSTAPLALRLSFPPGSSLTPAEVSASMEMNIPRSTLARHLFGPLHLDAAAKHGILEAFHLSLPVPGALLTASGGQRDNKTIVAVRFLAMHLGKLRAAAVALGIGTMPAIDGNGSIDLTGIGPRVIAMTGPTAEWSATIRSSFPRLRVGEGRYRGLTVDTTLSDLTAARQSVDLAASLKAPLKMAVKLSVKATETSNTLAPPGNGQRIDVELLRLALSYPGTRWTTKSPSQFFVEKSGTASRPESRMSLENLALYAGTQAIVADAHRDEKNLSANLKVSGLRVQDLPRVETLGIPVAGVLNVNVHAQGDPQQPRVRATINLRDGRADRYKGLDAELVATLLENRTVNGTAKIRARGLGNLVATFKGPSVTPPPPGAPLAVTIDIENLQVANLPIPAEAGVKAGGVMQAHVQIHGTASDPRIAAHVTGRKMTIEHSAKPNEREALVRNGVAAASPEGPQRIEFESVALDCDYASPRLDARIALSDDKQGSLHAAARSNIPIAELRTPGGLAIQKRPIVGSLRLRNFDPEAISTFVPSLQVIRGQISAAFEVRGTVSSPQLGGHMSWQKGELVVAGEEQSRRRITRPEQARLNQAAPEPFEGATVKARYEVRKATPNGTVHRTGSQ